MLKKSVSKAKILEKITTFHIFKRYAPPFHINKLFFGDIGRSKREKAPSANIIYIGKDWRYIDFAIGSFSAFDYVMAKYNLSFSQALEKIDIDFGLGFTYDAGISTNRTIFDYKAITLPEAVEKPRKIIKIKRHIWTQKDINYWRSNGWTNNMCHAAKIRPISAYYMTDNSGDLVRHNVKDELAYSYDYYTDDQGVFQRKIYLPERVEWKWFSCVNKDTVQGWELLPKSGDICFITSSLKDTGPFWRILGKPTAISANNEGSFIPESVYAKLKQRYKQIVLMWNNDGPGIINAKKQSQKHNLPFIHFELHGPKDPTEFVRSYRSVNVGLREFNWELKRLLNKLNG
jgi:hypothetical protein